MRASSITRSTVLQTLVCITCVSINLAVSQISTASVFTTSIFVVPHQFSPPDQPSFEIQAWTQPNGSGDGGFVETTLNSNLVLSPYSVTVGIGETWYSVTNGTVFAPSTRSTLTIFASNLETPPYPEQLQLSVGQDFYLAVWLQEPQDRYGWAHLKLTSSSTLTLLGSAIEDTGSGIIVGTTTVVPEPSSFCLTALASILLLLRSRSRR